VLKLARGLCFLLSFAALVTGTGCRREAGKLSVTIAVAANAVPTVRRISDRIKTARRFEVVIVEGATGTLARQAREGAPYDIFVSADRTRVAELNQLGLVLQAGVYAQGKLMAVFASTNETPSGTISPLPVRISAARIIAMPNPAHAPYGVAAQEYLESVGLAEEVKDRMVLCESVAQARQLVSTGNADVAFLPASMVQGNANAVEIPPESYRPIEQEAAILVHARENPAAVLLFDALFDDEGRADFLADGYLVPPKTSE
jgi:molybdate transport system substrate-binding protein